MSRRVVRVASLAAVIALLGAGAALADAGGQGTVTITQHAHNIVLFSAPATTCTGAPGTITATAANEVFHITFFTVSDEFWVTGTDEGTFTFTPNDPQGVTGSGHFAAHETSHLSTNASGDVIVNFDKMDMHMTCG